MRLENWSAIVYLIVSSDLEQCAKRQTLATVDDDRECCLLRSLDLFLDRGLEGGSEFAALMVGRFASGSKDCPEPAPGLVERERRGQGIVASLGYVNEQQNAVVDVALSLRHTIRLVMYRVSLAEWRWEEIDCMRFPGTMVQSEGEIVEQSSSNIAGSSIGLTCPRLVHHSTGFQRQPSADFLAFVAPCWCSSSISGRT